jgi:hypothetical protein
MAGWSDGVATAFKQVEGGYLFRLNPWLFGRSHGYLVDEAKRAEIVEQIRRNRNAVARANRFAVILMMIGLIGTTPFTSWARARGWSLDSTISLIIVVIVPSIGMTISVHVYMLRKLRPLLANLPRSHDIAFREWFRAQAQAASSTPWWMWLVGGFAALIVFAMFAIILGRALFVAPPDVGRPTFVAVIFFLTLPVLIFAPMTICCFVLASFKAKQHSASSE